MKQPLVSILTPCYNSGEFLTACIESVLRQDYPHIEHIVQDAASTDGTAEILKSYEDRIDVRIEPDKGQADGLNRALQRCKGEIILVLNADDYLLDGAVTWGVEQMATYPEAASVYGDQRNVDPDDRELSISRGPSPYDYASVFCVEAVIPAQASFIRRSALEAVGFYVDTTMKTCPDYEWWVRIGLSYTCVHVPHLVAAYRQHPGSESQQEHMIYDMMTAKREIVDRVCHAPDTPEAVRVLRNRAHASIINWGAWWLLTHRKLRGFLKHVWQAYRLDPSFKRLFRIVLGVGEFVLMTWPAVGLPIVRAANRLRLRIMPAATPLYIPESPQTSDC